MRFITIITFLLSFVFNLKQPTDAIYVMRYDNKEDIMTIINNCNVKDNEGSEVKITNINSNYTLDSYVGEYFITFDAADVNGNIERLKIKLIIIPPTEITFYVYKNQNKSIAEIMNEIGVKEEEISVVDDTYTSNISIAGEYEVKLLYTYIIDYCINIKMIILDEEITNLTPIIYPLYNRITSENLKELVSLNLGVKAEDVFSIKGDVDEYHSGVYKLTVMTTNNEIFTVDVIIKEMLPQKEVTLTEKLYLYLTIFFNLDARYMTNNFFDFDTRIKCIRRIYTTSKVRC